MADLTPDPASSRADRAAAARTDPEAVRNVAVRRLPSGGPTLAERDRVAVEAPLEIRVAGDTLATTMRTPGDDHFLAAGFLLAEGLVREARDLGRLAHCGRPGDESYGHTIDALPGAGFAFDLSRVDAARRGTLITSACGVCGRDTIEDLVRRLGRIGPTPQVAGEVLRASTVALFDHAQPGFRETGAMHAAALADAEGRLLTCAEDIGRHNAVDKAVGELFLAGRLEHATVLAVSGRVSFEIVQKAAAARVPFVTAVGGTSSLAISLAEEAGITLCAFVRGGRLNAYTHPDRIR